LALIVAPVRSHPHIALPSARLLANISLRRLYQRPARRLSSIAGRRPPRITPLGGWLAIGYRRQATVYGLTGSNG
jgi:hypothetical protein